MPGNRSKWMFLWEKHVSNGGFSKSCLIIGGSVAIDLELVGSKHSFLSGWSAQRPMLRAWNHQSDLLLFFFCSDGLEKGKTLVHPTTNPALLQALTKLVNLGYPNHQIGPGLCCLAFPHHDFWGLPRHFLGGSETSDTSLRAPVRAPGGPADVRVVVLPLGTSAQNALGPLSWGARAGPMVGMEQGGVLNFQGSLMLESSQWLRQIPNFACQGSYYRLPSCGWKASTQFRFPPQGGWRCFSMVYVFWCVNAWNRLKQ